MEHSFKKVYCDFDGTISKLDSVNNFLRLYAHKSWLEDEKLWNEGKISSRECMERQVKLLPAMDKDTFDAYLNSIELDDGFIEFYQYLASKNIELVVLSDGFDMFIGHALQRYSLNDIKYYANTLHYDEKGFSITFPNHNANCDIGSGSCKCAKISEKDFCYVGDGGSDFCVAKKAGKLFAKSRLKDYCDKLDIEYTSFETFRDILSAFKKQEELYAISN